MCGIAGFAGFKNDELIKKISNDLKHRGPDGEGIFSNEKVTLLNRRLAIIDLNTGNQPIFNEDKKLVIVYNGEIYNYLELRQILIKKGHKFSTKSDTEIIIHGYEEWGSDCFDKLNGMFAIALYDIKKDKLTLVRDHFGIKPLYYSIVNSKIIFSSEIKPIIYSGLVKKIPNDKIIYRYLKYRIHDDQEETFFKGVKRLMPGQLLEITNNKILVKTYTNLKNDLLKLSNHKNTLYRSGDKKFKNELIKAIKYRLISDVPVGTCLSGGLDSSTVVSVVNKLLNDQVKEAESIGKIQNTFSAVFPGGANDEEKYIDEVVKSLKSNIKCHKIKPTTKSFLKDLDDFVRTQEEPTISTGPYAQYKVMEEVSGKVKVLLDGQGADEMMAGYLPYYFVYLKQLLNEKKYLLFLKESFNSQDILKRYFFEKLSKVINPSQLLNQNFVSKFYNEKFIIENNNLKKRLIEDIFSNSLQSLLRYEDKNAMRYSIEGRVPFLDFNLLKYIFSLPDETIIKNGWNKFILRQATKDLLPELINKRRNKIGFTTPETQWFKTLQSEIFSIFSSTSFGTRKYFNQSKVLVAFKNFIKGKTNDSMIFWRLLNVELWMREFIDEPSVKVRQVHQVIKINKGKKVDIKINSKKYFRFPIKTDLFKKNDDFINKISNYVLENVINIKDISHGKWFVVSSEKIVAISQGRSYFIWDINPTISAKILSNFVTKTPYGIGLGSPYTMQLAINELGLFKITYSAILALLGKLIGIKGLFYKLTGPVIRSIDGPTEYSLYPSNVSAKLGPKDPKKVAENIKSQITNNKSIINNKYLIKNFLGAVVIDANDIGVNILGNSTGLQDNLIEKIFKDNPMGQTNEQTPIVIVVIK